jgi:hypothetical protein
MRRQLELPLRKQRTRSCHNRSGAACEVGYLLRSMWPWV